MKKDSKLSATLWLVLFVGLFLLPIATIIVLWKKSMISKNDTIDIMSGCLAYYGTIILGIVAVMQTRKSLKQTEKTFTADKYAFIKLRPECSFLHVKNTRQFYDNVHKYPMDAYFVKSDKNFDFNQENHALTFRLYYDTQNNPIHSIDVEDVKLTYNFQFYVDRSVKTDMCETPKKDCGKLQITFILSEKELDEIQELAEKGMLILQLKLKIVSSVGVTMVETVEANYAPTDSHDRKLALKWNDQAWEIDMTCYSFNKET